MAEKNALVSGLLGEKFNLDMMTPKISRESSKTFEGILVPLSFSITKEIPETQIKVGGMALGLASQVAPTMTATYPRNTNF